MIKESCIEGTLVQKDKAGVYLRIMILLQMTYYIRVTYKRLIYSGPRDL